MSLSFDSTRYSVFVGGPIQWAVASDGSFDRDLRIEINHALCALDAMGLRLLSAHVAERFGAEMEGLTPERIAQRDYAWMLQCDMYIALLPQDENGRLYRSEGTMIEIGWASALRKPTLLLTVSEELGRAGSQLLRGLGAVAPFRVLELATAWKPGGGLAQAIEEMLEPQRVALAPLEAALRS